MTKLRTLAARMHLLCAIFTTIILFGLAAPPAKAADEVGTVNFITAGSSITNNVTWLPSTVVKIDKQTQAGLAVKFKGDGSATDNIVFSLFRSWNGTDFESTAISSLKFTNALNNTTQVIGYHQIPSSLIGSVHSLKITIANAASSVSGTNATVALVKKKEFGW